MAGRIRIWWKQFFVGLWRARSLGIVAPIVIVALTGLWFGYQALAYVSVPTLTGLSEKQAQAAAAAAGLTVQVRSEFSATEPGLVYAQEPVPAAKLVRGSFVRVFVSKGPRPLESEESEESELEARPLVPPIEEIAEPGGPAWIVCLDPGHQAKANLEKEPNAPGSATSKEKVRGGSRGTVTGVPEYELVLAISLKLRDRLSAAGVTVVMTRETNDVNISNIQRAQIANDAGADLFVRVHADGSEDASVHGVSMLHPSSGAPTAAIYDKSVEAARAVQGALVRATGARDRGLSERGDITGFNWATVPSILPEIGFLSNANDDRQLNDPAYQGLVVDGLTAGILEFLEGT